MLIITFGITMITARKIFSTVVVYVLLHAHMIVNAQTFEKTFQPDFYSSITHTAPAPGGHWIGVGSFFDLSSGFFTPGYITSFDSAGNTDWSFIFVDTGETIEITDLIQTIDEQYFITGWQHYCDFGDLICFLKKFDAAGITSWTKYRIIPSYYPSGDPVACQMANGTYVLGIDTVLHFANSSGDSLTEVAFMNGEIFCLMETNVHQLTAGSEFGLTVLDANGIQVNFFPYASGVKKIVQREDSAFLALSGQKIFMLDPSFAIVDSVDLSADFVSVTTMKYDLGKLWLLGKNTSSPLTKVVTLDFAGIISPVLMFQDSSIIANDLSIDSTHIALMGKENTASSYHMYAGTFLHDGTHSTYTADAGVVSVRYDSVWAIHHSGPPELNTTYYDTYVTIKNFGTDTLHQVYLNAKLWGLSPCGAHPYVMYYFSSLSLAPNDTFEFHCGVLSETHWCLGLCTFTQCFWTSCPDGITDYNHLNDSACASFTIDIIDALPEIEKIQSIRITPNPFNSYLDLHFNGSQTGSGQLTIFNSIGGIILKKEINWEDQSVDVSSLAKGFYLLRIETQSEVFSKKVIKE